MAGLPRPSDPAVLVGTETSDDAGIYRLSDEQAIVCTADFITPLVDDPFLFGQIAAANALSDVYAMGGRPLAALALCLFPKELDPDAAREILAGGQSKVLEAGAAVVGGHTVRGDELLYGLSVTGVIEPERILRNSGARPGDQLVLTKPLGSGLIINGLRMGKITDEEAKPTLDLLAQLSRAACETLRTFGDAVHAATDLTGFGLVGHALEMAVGSGVALGVDLPSLPLYDGVREMVARGVSTGSTKPNRAHGAARLRAVAPLDRFWDELVHDPQTSGGLLIAVEASRAEELVRSLRAAGVRHAVRVGEAAVAPEPHLALRL